MSNTSQLRLIRPHQNTILLYELNVSEELRVPFNIWSHWSVFNSSKAICPKLTTVPN